MDATIPHVRRPFRRRRPPVGAPPGTLEPPAAAEATRLALVAYDGEEMVALPIAEAGEIRAHVGRRAVTWIDVQGLADLEALRTIAASFGLHSLALEDIVHVHQRPKVETYDDHLFIVLRMPRSAGETLTEQIAIILGPDYLITFQERHGDCFDPVRQRMRGGKGRIRSSGAGYLAYALIDACIDAYFPLLERYGEIVEQLEDEVVAGQVEGTVARLHRVKRELLELRRAIWPLREMVYALLREESALIGREIHTYLRDCHDHTIQLMDMLETYRELASGLVDVYLTGVSARTNEIMKVLTIIATIFIPLGFVAGVYGMNFDPEVSPFNMPELGWYLGYPFALTIMLAVALGLLGFFYRRGWLGGPPARKKG